MRRLNDNEIARAINKAEDGSARPQYATREEYTEALCKAQQSLTAWEMVDWLKARGNSYRIMPQEYSQSIADGLHGAAEAIEVELQSRAIPRPEADATSG